MSKDLVSESRRILEHAEHDKIVLRLLGGLAIKYHCPSATHRSLSRKNPDMDFLGLSTQSKAIRELLPKLGYTAAEHFNAVHGANRLLFSSASEEALRIDVFLDTFDMCFRFDFRDRLTIGRYTLSLSDLLITKLQIVELNERDIQDMICILFDHEVGDRDSEEVINAQYIADLCSRNWGMYRTFTANLKSVSSKLDDYQLPGNKEVVTSRINDLLGKIERKPKSLSWKMRAAVGDKATWYELPEPPKKITFGE
jgi:hypothetical protein